MFPKCWARSFQNHASTCCNLPEVQLFHAAPEVEIGKKRVQGRRGQLLDIDMAGHRMYFRMCWVEKDLFLPVKFKREELLCYPVHIYIYSNANMYINRSSIFGWRVQNQKSAFWISDFFVLVWVSLVSSLYLAAPNRPFGFWILQFLPKFGFCIRYSRPCRR